ncbi:hypothetical protein WHR41_05671 [Cladosporium halotolerans]|uniref:Uncharacterized protein n=1 Tax=Cladosporium halotolerans TaxID=1052096 RepID=A0AB34KK38_9PEZI
MLERAAACLDSGARLSVRCARRVSRNNRSLSSTFWHHGAGDLEILPGSSVQPTPHTVDVKASRNHCDGELQLHTDKDADRASVSGGPFLDFLYPPQALALLRRGSGKRAERWQRGNERRLPRGFGHATRRYSSKPPGGVHRTTKGLDERFIAELQQYSRKADDESEEPSSPQIQTVDTAEADPGAQANIGADPNVEAEPKFESDPNIENDTNTGAATNAGQNAKSEGDTNLEEKWSTGAEEDVEVDDTIVQTSDELSDVLVSAKELRTFLNNSSDPAVLEDAQKSLEQTENAWSMYERLHETDRASVGLRIRLLEWLSSNRNETAETHFLELYDSIPIPQRTMAVYKSALPTLMRSNLYGLAEQGHVEALEHLQNGHEISIWLCSTAIENDMWELASRVKQQLDTKHEGQAQPWIDAMFWRHISETPDLLSKAIRLSKHYRMLAQADALSPEFQRFSMDVFKYAIFQELTNSRSRKSSKSRIAKKTLKDSRIRYLVGRVQLTSQDSPRFFHDVLSTLVQPKFLDQYPDAHKTVSYMYKQYRSMSGAIPDAALLTTLVQRAIEFADIAGNASGRAPSLSVAVLENDWNLFHGKMTASLYGFIMTHYARRGNPEAVRYYLDRFLAAHPAPPDDEGIMWNLVYVYARRGEHQAAEAAFEEIQSITAAAGTSPSLRCWNILIHAHSRADDIDAALETFKRLMSAGKQPDRFSFHPILELYAARGDVGSVETLLEQYDQLCNAPRSAELYASLMTANINAGNVDVAWDILQEAEKQAKNGELEGPLTICFNILLTSLALRREPDHAMRVYQWMRREQVPIDATTYAALMQTLVLLRKTNAAWKILKTVMPEHGVKPVAFHYAVVMTGYVRQNAFGTAISIYHKMLSNRIRPTLSTNAIYAKARARYELKEASVADDPNTVYPVAAIVDELEELFEDPSAGLAAQEPQYYSVIEDHSPKALMFSALINAYGAARSLEAVQELLERYRGAEQTGALSADKSLPLKLLTMVMPTYARARDWDEVEKCWNLAKKHVDALTADKPAPRLAPPTKREKTPAILRLPTEERTAEYKPPGENFKAAIANDLEDSTRPLPGLRRLLSRPLQHYITALAQQNRFNDIISAVTAVLTEGYILDNFAWNRFIQLLLRPSPPLALLAFRLTERYLIPSFPGWRKKAYNRGAASFSNPSARFQKLQYINIRYPSPETVAPVYPTLVKLAAALLQLRYRENVGIKTKCSAPGLDKYVGTTRLIRQLAPQTLYAVQTIPNVNDHLQTKLLRRET